MLAPASRHDSVLLASTLPEPPTVHLDRGDDSPKTEAELAARELRGQVAKRGKPAPIQVGQRWPVGRTNSWVSNFRKLARGTERVPAVIELWLSFAHAIITLRRLIREAWVAIAGIRAPPNVRDAAAPIRAAS